MLQHLPSTALNLFAHRRPNLSEAERCMAPRTEITLPPNLIREDSIDQMLPRRKLTIGEFPSNVPVRLFGRSRFHGSHISGVMAGSRVEL